MRQFRSFESHPACQWVGGQDGPAVGRGNGQGAQEARGPQVTAFCEKLRVVTAFCEKLRFCPVHRGRGVDDLTNVFPDTSRKRQRRRRPVHNVVNVVTNLHPKYSSQVNGVSFSADGSLVASCSGNTGSFVSGDCSVRMWSVETGQELKKFLGHRCVVSGCCMRGVAVCACSPSPALPLRGSLFSASQKA